MAAGSKVSGKRGGSPAAAHDVGASSASVNNGSDTLNTREGKRARDPFANVWKEGRHYEIDDIHAVMSWAGIFMIYTSYVTWICFGYVAEYEQCVCGWTPLTACFRYIIKILVFFRLAVNPIAAPKVRYCLRSCIFPS